MSVHIIGDEWHESGDLLVTVETRKWGKSSQAVWRGSSTVWRNAKTGKRAPRRLEICLSETWTVANWSREQVERNS